MKNWNWIFLHFRLTILLNNSWTSTKLTVGNGMILSFWQGFRWKTLGWIWLDMNSILCYNENSKQCLFSFTKVILELEADQQCRFLQCTNFSLYNPVHFLAFILWFSFICILFMFMFMFILHSFKRLEFLKCNEQSLSAKKLQRNTTLK